MDEVMIEATVKQSAARGTLVEFLNVTAQKFGSRTALRVTPQWQAEGDLPVVPIRLKIHRFGSPSRFPFVRRGHVGVRFGKPLTFTPRTPYVEATTAIEDAIRTR